MPKWIVEHHEYGGPQSGHDRVALYEGENGQGKRLRYHEVNGSYRLPLYKGKPIADTLNAELKKEAKL